jgi:pyruvate formate lyase activating enzyme
MNLSEQQGLIFNIQKFSLHDGPGIRTTVFLKGCPLRCGWCANPESQSAAIQTLGDGPDSRLYTVDEVVDLCVQDEAFYLESGGGVTLSGGEPLAQPAFATRLLTALKERRLHTALETTGFASSETFYIIGTLADLLLFDIKHYDDVCHKAGTGVDNALILANFRHSVTSSGAEVLPRIPVIPGFNATLKDAAGFCRLFNDVGVKRAQLLPFHQMGDRKYELLGRPYELRGVKPLYAEDLTDYQQVFIDNGVEAFF